MKKKGTPPTKQLFIIKGPTGNYAVDEWSSRYAMSRIITIRAVIGEERITGRVLMATDWRWLQRHDFIDVLCCGAFDKRRSIWVEVGGV